MCPVEGREIGRGVWRLEGAVADAGEVTPLHTILHRRKAQKKGQGVACVWRDGCSAQLRVAFNTFLCQMQKMAGWGWGRCSSSSCSIIFAAEMMLPAVSMYKLKSVHKCCRQGVLELEQLTKRFESCNTADTEEDSIASEPNSRLKTQHSEAQGSTQKSQMTRLIRVDCRAA